MMGRFGLTLTDHPRHGVSRTIAGHGDSRAAPGLVLRSGDGLPDVLVVDSHSRGQLPAPRSGSCPLLCSNLCIRQFSEVCRERVYDVGEIWISCEAMKVEL